VNDSNASPRSIQRTTVQAGLALLGLLLLAFALRVYQLQAQSLWYDEGVSWYMTRMSLSDLTIWTADDIQPPLYYYLLWGWTRLAGTSEYALRFPSVFFGMISVPLLWVTARRLLGKRAAWLASLLLALSPLHVYYAQEARMYTLLTFLGLLSSYLLLRLLNSQSPNLRSPLTWAYILSAVAALYTHYFAFFLLAAHVIYALYGWWKSAPAPVRTSSSSPNQERGREHLFSERLGTNRALIAIPVAIFVLYLPWLPFLVTRYGVDTSYWPGSLKLGELAPKMFIAFSLGETVTEGVGAWLAAGYGVILLVGLVALLGNKGRVTSSEGREGPQPIAHYPFLTTLHSSLVFMLLYLFIPVILTLLLASRTPKFNPRYAMLASPAFILLIAGGLTSIRGQGSRHRSYALRLIPIAALIYILATSVYSLQNWFAPYRINQFNKADFRITAQIVRERIGPEETVLLNSGHMFPAWAYYYGWDGWGRLPDIEILDVNAALDLSVGDELDRLLRGKRGVWLVRWQNEVTDPFDVLPLYLGAVGTQDDYGQFWHMELFHYSLPPGARFDLAYFITLPIEADFSGQVRLLGGRQTSSTELLLFWQALTQLETDYTIFVHLLGADGETLVNADHLPSRPTREWRPGQVLPDRVALPLPSDLPAGDYWVEIGLYNAGDPALPRLALANGSGDQVILPLHLDLPVEAEGLE
jgi:mannosyltransferase